MESTDLSIAWTWSCKMEIEKVTSLSVNVLFSLHGDSLFQVWDDDRVLGLSCCELEMTAVSGGKKESLCCCWRRSLHDTRSACSGGSEEQRWADRSGVSVLVTRSSRTVERSSGRSLHRINHKRLSDKRYKYNEQGKRSNWRCVNDEPHR